MTEDRRGYGLPPGGGHAVWFAGGVLVHVKTHLGSKGSLGVVEQVLPVGYATPHHIHHREDEAWYILEGEVRFHCGDDTVDATAGSFVFGPRGLAHGFANVGSTPARLLTLNAPGGGFEHVVVESGEPVVEGRPAAGALPDLERLTRIAAQYGIEIVGPPRLLQSP